jgi:hypothetical protein
MTTLHNRGSSPLARPPDWLPTQDGSDANPKSHKQLDPGSSITPLPYAKIIPLLIARASEGLIYAVIFPYVNEMIHAFGVPEQSVGMWSSAVVC